jgi:hypothetical protein
MTNVMRWRMTFPLAAVIAATVAHATPAIDQQQNVIDSTVGGSAIGGGSAQQLAQVVTAGTSGFLTEVRFPVACDAGSSLIGDSYLGGNLYFNGAPNPLG